MAFRPTWHFDKTTFRQKRHFAKMTFRQKRHFDKNDISTKTTFRQKRHFDKNDISTKRHFDNDYSSSNMTCSSSNVTTLFAINKFGAVLFFSPDRQTDRQTDRHTHRQTDRKGWVKIMTISFRFASLTWLNNLAYYANVHIFLPQLLMFSDDNVNIFRLNSAAKLDMLVSQSVSMSVCLGKKIQNWH